MATWPGELCVAWDAQADLRTSHHCVGVLLSLILSLQGDAMKTGVCEILMFGYLEVSHRNHSSWWDRLSVASAKRNFQAFPLGFVDQKR